jgi:hypothetical protein
MALIPEIPELRDVIKGDLAMTGDWVVASVQVNMSWPVYPQRVLYRGVELWILPVMKDHYPGVAMKRPKSINREDSERLIMRFLSAVSWVEKGGILLEHFTVGNLPRPVGLRQQRHGFGIQDDFNLAYLPAPDGEKAQLALALMREGRGLNHAAYAFLSFYRVLEVACPEGKKRGDWITAHIVQLQSQRALEALALLTTNNINDVGEHLQKSGRQAIAHARSKPIINPDDPEDARRLASELPIMSELAELAIERVLGVETQQTVWRKHLYELAGFKKLLGDDLVSLIAKGDLITQAVAFPSISVGIRKREPYKSLTKLQVASLKRQGSFVTLFARSSDKCFGFQCHLDFPNERLHFDVFSDLRANDDGTAEGADGFAELERFCRDYLCNGELSIENSETGELISRKDAFIPTNCYVDADGCNAKIEHWMVVAQERRNRNESEK